MIKHERLIALGIGIFFIILVNAPILFFYLLPKENLAFLGRRVINSQDTYTYVSNKEQSKQAKWLLTNLYSTEPQKASLVRPSYLVLGKIAAVLNISSITAFHLGKVILSIVLVILLYKFLYLYFDTGKKRLIAFTILLSSSGLGIFLRFFVPNTTDLWIPEANTFLTLGESPHFIFSQILMLGGFMLFLLFLKSKRYKYLLLSVLCFLLLGFEHPYDLFIVGPVIFLTSLLVSGVNASNIVKSFFYAALSSIGLAYQILQLYLNPVLKNWQVDSLSPSPTNYLAGFGLLIPLAIVGVERFLNEAEIKYKFILIWIACTLVLIYSPFDFQRRMIEGVHIPITILAVIGLFFIAEMFKKWEYQIIFGTMILLSLTSFFSLYNDFQLINKDSSNGYYYYISRSEDEAIKWIKANSVPNDAVLANWFYGNIIPGIAGRKVYLGHKAQSGNFDKKIESINQFLLSKDDKESIRFLQASNIRYVFLGNNDSMLQYGFRPDEKSFLKKVYTKNGVSIYEFVVE